MIIVGDPVYLIETPLHIVTAAVVFVFGFILTIKIANKDDFPQPIAIGLYLWHSLMCLMYAMYALENGADANRYFLSDVLDITHFKFGSHAIDLITSYLRLIGLSYLGCFLFFQIIGLLGLLYFSITLHQLTKQAPLFYRWFAIALMFLPSVSFWSAAIGKDVFSFLATALVLRAGLDFQNKKLLLIVAFFLLVMVRPHIGGILVISLSFAFIIDKETPKLTKMYLGVMSLAATAVIVPVALKHAGVGENVSASSISDYVDKRQNANTAGGSSLDISSMSLPMKMFTYSFRPLPHEAHNFAALMAAVDNMFLFIVFAYGMTVIKKRKQYPENQQRLFLWTYSLMICFLLSMTTANLGLAMRQKWMYMPILVYLLFSAVIYSHIKITTKQSSNQT